ALRAQATARNDKALNIESGYPTLLAFQRERVVGDATQVLRNAVSSAVVAVAEQLEARFVAEREALADTTTSAELVANLEAAKERAAALRGRAARWQQTLNDGFADLAADAD